MPAAIFSPPVPKGCRDLFGSHPGGTVGLGEQQAEMAPYGVFTTVSRDAFGIP